MEGVGARLGRSSTRYVPATVFTGPVRRWKKKWVHAPAPSSSSSPNHHAAANSAVNTASHLLLYKWTPIKDSAIGIQGIYNSNTDSNASNASAEEPVKKKFKYIPIVVLEEQKNEPSEANPKETDTITVEATSKSDGTIDESQAMENNPVEQSDLNESTFDLSLGLNGEDEDEAEAD